MKSLPLALLAFALVGLGTGCDSSSETSTLSIGADAVQATEETATEHAVLANDLTTAGGLLTLAAVTAPAHGTATITSTDRVTYTPAAGYVGTDSYTYTARDRTGTQATGTVTVTVQPLLVGSWRAEGLAVSSALYNDAAFPTRRIDATFNADQTYRVVATSESGASATSSGTWQLTGPSSGRIRSLRLAQSAPSVLTSTGIYAVAAGGATMQYEMAQTDPAVAGLTAPTPAGGFGSTVLNGAPLGTLRVQTFTRVAS